MSTVFRGTPRIEHLVRGAGGLAGEVSKLREDVASAFNQIESLQVSVARFVGPSTGLADADGIKTAFNSAVGPVTLTVADFDGALAPASGPAILNTPKRLRLTVAGTGTPAHWLGGTVTFIGTDSSGAALSEDVTSAAGAGNTDTVGYFATVTQVELPLAGGGAASIVIGSLADTASITTITSSVEAQTLDGIVAGDWNRDRNGNRPLAYPRRINFVFNSDADWLPLTITVRGRDGLGNLITSSILVNNGGGTTVVTDKFFSSIERISVPAMDGAAGTCAVAPEELSVGFLVDPISDVEAAAVLREVSRANSAAAWAVPGTAGVIDDSSITNAAPFGRYLPHSSVPFDGVREYVLAYLPKTV